MYRFIALGLLKFVEHRTDVREVEGSKPRSDQRSRSENNLGQCAAFAMTFG